MVFFSPWIYFSLFQQKHHSLYMYLQLMQGVATSNRPLWRKSLKLCTEGTTHLQEGRKCLVTTEQFVSSSKTTTECMQARNRCCCFDLCRQTGSPNTNPNFLNFFRYYLLVNITTYVAAFDKKLNITPSTKCLVLASLPGPLLTFPLLAVLQGLG